MFFIENKEKIEANPELQNGQVIMAPSPQKATPPSATGRRKSRTKK
jgi:hypothetical protein